MKSPYPGSLGATPGSVSDAGRAEPQDTDETTCPGAASIPVKSATAGGTDSAEKKDSWLTVRH